MLSDGLLFRRGQKTCKQNLNKWALLAPSNILCLRGIANAIMRIKIMKYIGERHGQKIFNISATQGLSYKRDFPGRSDTSKAISFPIFSTSSL